MIEEGNTGFETGAAAAVQIQGDTDLGLQRLALNLYPAGGSVDGHEVIGRQK
jgi:hypothetical protein